MSEDRICTGPNYHPGSAPDHALVRAAVETLKAHLHAEWISDGCEADHAFGCASCQAMLLTRELDGVLAWLDGDADDALPSSPHTEKGE